MFAPTTTQIPHQRRTPVLPETSGRSPWPDPEPAARRWLENVFAGLDAKLHRVDLWKRGGDGRIRSRCGLVSAVIWVEPLGPLAVRRERCLGCEDADDAR